jgi:YD repeat-containing protein
VVNYGWDDRSRLARVWTSAGHQTTFHFRPDDHLESITYDGYARFQYAYDSSRNVTSVTYPDGVRLDRSFGRDGRLASVGCGAARITCRWSSGGDLEEYTIEDGPSRACFLNKEERSECILAPAAGGKQRLPSISVHPLGIWQFGAEGHLDKVLAPWGERWVCTRSPQNLPVTIWGTRGLQRFSFSSGNVLRAIIAATGQRLYFHTLPDPARVLLVTAESVTLLEYDKNRRLAKLRGMGGGFCYYKRRPSGEIQHIETPLGKTNLAYDAEGRIRSVKLATGGTCVFRFGENLLRPDVLLVTGQRGLGAMLVRDVTTFCWSWLGIKGTLRLETEPL